MKPQARIINRKLTSDTDCVTTVIGGSGDRYCRQPCPQCPWRRENAGNFSAEAFRTSANTSYDAATATFACHMSSTEDPAVCAGFLLQNAVHNMGVRLRAITGRYDPSQMSDGGADLFNSYREMAEANGVDPADEALTGCRGNDE